MMRRLPTLLLLLLAACNLPFETPEPAPPAPTETAVATPTLRVGFMEPTLPVVVELPTTPIEIDGKPYVAYQTDDDPFRFVCPAPCTGYTQLIYWQYAGF